jgi:glutathione peroxidase
MNFSFPGLTYGTIAIDDYAGKVILVVNTASACGFTPQYAGLERLYRAKYDQGLVIIGVPCDDFGGQEPQDEAGIDHFCQINYGVTFPMAAKQHVKGPIAHPFYAYATHHFGWLGKPKWNFHKYLINRNGGLVDYFHSSIAPESRKLLAAIEKELAK